MCCWSTSRRRERSTGTLNSHVDLVRMAKDLPKQWVAHVDSATFLHSGVHGGDVRPDARRDLRIVGFRLDIDALFRASDRPPDLRPVIEQEMKPFSVLDESRVVPLTAATCSAEAALCGAGLFLPQDRGRLLSPHQYAKPNYSEHNQDAYRFHGVPFGCARSRCRPLPALSKRLTLRQRSHDIQRREHPEKTVPVLDHGEMMDAVLDHDPRSL